MNAAQITERVLSFLPERTAREIRCLGASWRYYPDALSEIRLRAGGRSSLVLNGENLPLGSLLTARELAGVFSRLCGHSVYAYRDTVASGYLTLPGAVRVGVAGEARYDGGRLCAVGDVRSLVFRLPTHLSEVAYPLYRQYIDGIGRGMLIFSPPGAGKTSALRELARLIGSGRGARRVVVVDERCEFPPELYADATVDILAGIRRAEGIALAMRTLSPEVVMTDEIGDRGEAEEIRRVIGGGVPLIASAHAASFSGVLARESLSPLLAAGVFDRLAGIFRTADGFRTEVRSFPC